MNFCGVTDKNLQNSTEFGGHRPGCSYFSVYMKIDKIEQSRPILILNLSFNILKLVTLFHFEPIHTLKCHFSHHCHSDLSNLQMRTIRVGAYWSVLSDYNKDCACESAAEKRKKKNNPAFAHKPYTG